MLNAEKFKDKIMYSCDGEFGFTDGIVKCAYDKCDNCIFSNRNNQDKHESCSSRRVRWLLSEYKEHIKVTRLEYELLKFIGKKGYKYLARDSLGSLCVNTLKPHRDVKVWKTNMKYLGVGLLYSLFQFVQWENSEPTPIKEVLENCEVVEDAEE